MRGTGSLSPLSQPLIPAPGKKIYSRLNVGVSREIIGRYERNEVSPSVEVAKKIADVLEVSLDYLAGDSDKAAFDKQTLKLIGEIEELEPATKDKLFFLANAIIRDAKTGKAYAH